MADFKTLLPEITQSRGIFENRWVCGDINSCSPAVVVSKLHAVPLADPQQVQGRLAVGESQVLTDRPGRHAHTVIENLRRRVTRHTFDFLQHTCQRCLNGLRRVLINYVGAATTPSLDQLLAG